MAYSGRIGIELDNLLCPTERIKKEWGRNDPALSFLGDNPFWASLEPYSDISELAVWLHDKDYYIFAERPASLLPMTRGWLRKKCGFDINKDRIVMQALKRYDCRLREIDAFIDSSPTVIENLKLETVVPVQGYFVNRQEGESITPILEELDGYEV